MPDAQSPTRHFAANVKRHRMVRGWTQPQLAERCQAVGLDWDRSIIANVEAGRRASVSLLEVLTLAYVFDVPAALMVFPVGLVDDVEVLPGKVAGAWEAARWFTGEAPAPADWLRREYGGGEGERIVDDERIIDHIQRRRDAYIAGAAPMELFRRHDRVLAHYSSLVDLPGFKATARSADAPEIQRIGETALRDLRAVRAEMRRHGLKPPDLPEDLKHVDDERFVYLAPAEAESLLRDHGIRLRPVVEPREPRTGGTDEPQE